MPADASIWGSNTALIGHTGFVGSTLAAYRPFQGRFNSSSIGELRGQSYDTVVCAGAPAAKWIANGDPEADWANISSLIEILDTVAARRFVLVSTIDVYFQPKGVTEADLPPEDHPEAYGRNRRRLEKFVEERFEASHVVRLPGLFGHGLKKNAIYDLLNDNQVDRINPNSAFQWYPTRRFGADLEAVISSDLDLLNLSVEPVATRQIADAFFPDARIGSADLPAARYDMHTLHAGVLGGDGPYHLKAADVMTELDRYIGEVRG